MAAPGPVVDPQDRNKIKVSSGRSVFFYVDLATRFLKDQEDVELSGLGYAITTVVTIAEILKNQGIASVKKINTSTMDIKERPVSKAKIEITLIKTPKFFEIVEQKEAAKAAPAAPV
eukprot:Phypoly_transcript_11978.p1 GENE.Phypoly_transcript_11978~~Phypoly_transcript_11978.p1  ORF type:complete len:117 (+),score=28.61 Phypoly_transcript_11978:444-794(+)